MQQREPSKRAASIALTICGSPRGHSGQVHGDDEGPLGQALLGDRRWGRTACTQHGGDMHTLGHFAACEVQKGPLEHGSVLLWATAPLGNCTSFVGLLAGRFLHHRLNLLGGAGVTGLNLWSIVVAKIGAIILPFARLPSFFHTMNAT